MRFNGNFRNALYRKRKTGGGCGTMRAMQKERTYRIGLLVERTRAFGRELCEGIITYAQDRDDWELRFLNPTDLRRRDAGERHDGFIARVTSDRIAGLLSATGKPVVDLYYEKPRTGFAIVKTRHESIGCLAAEHFLDRRFKNFAYCPYGGGRTSLYCQMAFIRRLRRAGFGCTVYGGRADISYDFDDSNLINDSFAPPKDAKRLTGWLLSIPKPTAVFCPGDLRARQITDICRTAGINVPHEVAVLGLDNDLLICGSSRPMLSSIDPHSCEIGRVAAETLAEMIEHGIPGKPIIRQIPPAGVVTRASSETAPVEPSWLADALVYIQRNAKRGISAADVFAALGRSHTIVSRAFRKTLGTTVQKEIAAARLDIARHLLSTTEKSVTRIAALSGFSSVAYFMQSFSAVFGMAPGAWRQKHKGAP